MPFVSAIIVAGGNSSRMGGADKLLLDLAGKSVIERTVDLFCENALTDEIIIVASAENGGKIRELCGKMPKVSAVVTGGPTRALSVQNGVASASKSATHYAIHDGARPFASDELITRVIKAAIVFGAAAPGVKVTDTIKEIDDKDTVVRTPERSALVSIATPQVFEAVLYRAASKGRAEAYDDCQLLERVGRKTLVVAGERENIKLTEPADIVRARLIMECNAMRIGNGYDAHRFAKNRALILGGVEIPYEMGLLGHSDADVVTHAIIDALLGAAALPDIGSQFPDSDERFKDISSLDLLHTASELIARAGYRVGNIDATIVCQSPKLKPYIKEMREKLSFSLGVSIELVNVKATTEEGMGFTGEGLGIASHAAALILHK
ncbi:MAG: 2-C-methyl-D-erythritol 2,4-cyclodiphosphate synthase [Oscillospiraceae bacterium]